PESRGVTSLWFRHALERVFTDEVLKKVVDPIPGQVRERYHLPDLQSALVWIHTPQNGAHAEAARKRFAFEEIFAIQVARAKERSENDALASFPISQAAEYVEQFL